MVRQKLSLVLTFVGAIALSYTLTQCTVDVPRSNPDAACVVQPEPVNDLALPAMYDLVQSLPDLAHPPDLAIRRTMYAWWEFTRWWHLIGHGGGYCAPDDGNWMNAMDAFCKNYGFSWAILNGTRPLGNCTTWSGWLAPVYDTITCGP